MRAFVIVLAGCNFSGSGTLPDVDAKLADSIGPAIDAPADARAIDSDDRVDAMPDAVTCRTDVRYTGFSSHRYRALPATGYLAAKAACEADGAHLATIDDDAENTYVEGRANVPWIGFDDLAVEGTFVWVFPATGSFTKWDTNEPSNANGNEDCTYILPMTQQRKWNDDNCTIVHTAVCECEP